MGKKIIWKGLVVELPNGVGKTIIPLGNEL